MSEGRVLPKIICRCCKKSMDLQNYEPHLKRKHPEEDPSDKRGYGQTSLFGFTALKRQDGGKTVPVGIEHGVGEEGEERPRKQMKSTPATGGEAFKLGQNQTEDGVQAEVVSIEEGLRGIDNELVEGEEKGEMLEGEEEGEMLEAEIQKPETQKDENQNEDTAGQADLRTLSKVLQDLVQKGEIEADFSSCQSEQEKVSKCLHVLERSLKLKKDVASLVDNLKELKLVHEESGSTVSTKINMDEKFQIGLAKSVKEIAEKVPIFVFDYQQAIMKCSVCSQTFACEEGKFPYLKKALKRHLECNSHINMVEAAMVKSREGELKEARDKVINSTIGGLVYHLVYQGRPDSDLPLLIYRVKRAGGVVGDVNHSDNLVSNLLPEIAGVVEKRLKTFLHTPMVATGALPPVNIMADKATDKRFLLKVKSLWD